MRQLHSIILFFSLLLFINISSLFQLHAQQFNYQIEKVVPTEDLKTDSTFRHWEEVRTQSKIENNIRTTIEASLVLTAIERIQLNYSSAFTYAGEALFLAEEFNDSILCARANEEVAILNYLFKQDKQAFQYYNKAHVLYRTLFGKGIISKPDLLHSYYNMLMYSHRIVDLPMAQCYLDSCQSLLTDSGDSQFSELLLNEKRSIILNKNGQIKEGINLLQNTAETLEKYSLGEKYYHEANAFLIVIYYSIANRYAEQNKMNLACSYAQKSIDQPDFYGEFTFFRSFVMGRYASYLESQNEHQMAYNLLVRARKINDAYLNPRKDSPQDFLVVKDGYKEALRSKHLKINEQRLIIAEGKEKILHFRNYVILLLLTIAVLVFTFGIYWMRTKHKKETEINLHKQKQSKELLDHKNRELTTSMLQLIEKDEIIKKLSQNLEKTTANKSLLSSIEHQSGNLWKSFNSRFLELNKDFYNNLKSRAPGLSAADLKICALIKLNFSGKEMAYLLGISEGSVNVARHRLRKKINLQRQTNLAEFIHSI